LLVRAVRAASSTGRKALGVAWRSRKGGGRPVWACSWARPVQAQPHARSRCGRGSPPRVAAPRV
jgi:hypothetical protein